MGLFILEWSQLSNYFNQPFKDIILFLKDYKKMITKYKYFDHPGLQKASLCF